MAAIDLHLYEVEDGWMPPVCARCGERGRFVRAKTVVWSPWWMPLVVLATGFVIWLPFARYLFFGAVDTGRRVTIHLPFCDRHRNHWRWRSWPLAGVLILALAVIGGGAVAVIGATRWDPMNQVRFLIVDHLQTPSLTCCGSSLLAWPPPKDVRDDRPWIHGSWRDTS